LKVCNTRRHAEYLKGEQLKQDRRWEEMAESVETNRAFGLYWRFRNAAKSAPAMRRASQARRVPLRLL